MSFMPLWPCLQPRETDPLWFNADRPVDDETEVQALEDERKAWRFDMRMEGYDHVPIGKSSTDQSRGFIVDGEEEEEEEEEGEGEEEEDETDTHEEEEEELDEIHMETS